jgi:hypothetical protein
VACFNVENLAAPGERTMLTRFRFEPARRRHLEHVAAVIETLAPDVVVMPEVVSREGVDAVVNLLHAKGLKDYRGYHVDGRDRFSGFDVAILSRIEPDELDGRRIHIFVPAATKRSAKRPRDGGGPAQKPPGDAASAADAGESTAEAGDGSGSARTCRTRRTGVVGNAAANDGRVRPWPSRPSGSSRPGRAPRPRRR